MFFLASKDGGELKTARNINLKGQVVERGTRKPLRDAQIAIDFIDSESDTLLAVPFELYINTIAEFGNQYIEDNKLITTTDSVGCFAFYSLPACTIQVECVVSGYEPLWERIFIPGNESVEIIVNHQILRDE